MWNNNSNFHKARQAKNDEFYTKLSDIEEELKYYKHHFKDKESVPVIAMIINIVSFILILKVILKNCN